MPNKRVYSITIFWTFPPPYWFIWLYLFSFSTFLNYQIFHFTRLFGSTYSIMKFMYLKIHPTRLFGPTHLIGTWEYVFLDNYMRSNSECAGAYFAFWFK